MADVTPEIRAMIDIAAEEKAKTIIQSAYFSTLTMVAEQQQKLSEELEEMREQFVALARIIMTAEGEEEPEDDDV